ncbi:MAG: transposase, partial [Myxococcota bacterium]
RLVIAQKVAQDRIVSLTDPQARHGRKSKSQTFNGFKVHVLGDVVSGLIASVSVTPGNVHDGAPSHRLLARAKQLVAGIDRVLADTAYGGARDHFLAKGVLGITLVTPPPAVSTESTTLRKQEFAVDFEAGTATCPNGVLASRRSLSLSKDFPPGKPAFHWSAATCAACPLKVACLGESTRGRTVVLHPYERELRLIRDQFERAETRAQYRRRSECERLVNQLTRHGAREARAFGLQKAHEQAHIIAMRCNLALLARALAAREAAAAA